MLFNSLQFALFFVVVTTLYFVLPHRARWPLLLGASCYFYMALIPIYIVILGGTIVVDYAAGILIERSTGTARRGWLILSLLANVGILAVFKYYNFLSANVNLALSAFGHANLLHSLDLILPVGLSFHTFQAMSYTIEVYRGRQKAERNPGIYALYVMFYPQLVAGPIERPQNLLHQFRERHVFDEERVVLGLRRMFWGLFKKLVIADRLALLVNPVFNAPGKHSSLVLLLALYAFAFQIYADFSGYTDIAIGAAEVMGFRLRENFQRPYAARTISEFWSRWHISLSTWFRDYVYIPLGGNRVTRIHWYRNLVIVFLVSGLWHGANWTFIVWGGLHAAFMIFGVMSREWRARLAEFTGVTRHPRIHNALAWACTFNLVTLAWVFFRANNVGEAVKLLRRALLGLPASLWHPTLSVELAQMGIGRTDLLMTILFVLTMEVLQYYRERTGMPSLLSRQPVYIRWAVYPTALLLIAVFGQNDAVPFIYFQF